MKLSVVGAVGLCVAVWASPAHAASSETLAECTKEQLTEAQQIIALHEIEKTCPTLKIDAAGVPDLTNLAFCSDEKCTKTIKRVRKSMPSCLYDGKRLRVGMTKLVKACETTSSAKSGDDDSGSGSPAATAAPKSKKPKKTATPAPSEGAPITSKTGSQIGDEEGNLIEEAPATIAPETSAPTTVPVTTAPVTVPTVAKTSSPASTFACGTVFVAMASTAIVAILS